MLLDAAGADRSAFARSFDVCVVGTGPAGLTLARKLAAARQDVALIEAGGLDIATESQDLYAGEVVGLDYYDPYIARVRAFGGSSNHWEGRCRELDAYDFVPRPFQPLSGWPIGKPDLDAYAAEADTVLELPPTERLPDEAVDGPKDRLVGIQYRRSPPVRFGRKYRDEIAASERIALLLNANLVDLRLDETGRVATEAVLRSYAPEDPGLSVRARCFCLCLGGLENPRFLLNARSQIPAGIGNQNDLVGRFFCEHPHFTIADVLFEDVVPLTANYAATPGFLERNQVLNFALRLATERRDLSREAVRSLACMTGFTERLAERVFGRQIGCGYGGLGEYFANAKESGTGTLQINLAQSLDSDSRVRLGTGQDTFGHAPLAVDWRLGALDYRSMFVAAQAMGEHLAERGVGRVRIRDWLLAEHPVPPRVGEDMVGGYHHMCTTRMSDDPKTGVVDRDCRVHGTANLYLGGSSVFSTPGHANPTYTIVQLALRLGDHLAETLRS